MQLPFGQPPRSLCIVRLSAIGDTCHTVPVVRAIEDAWPGTQLTWIVGKTEHSLLKGLEGVEFIVLDKSRGWRGYAAAHRALAGRRFDALLHMHASARANLVSLLVRSKLRIGFDKARARDQQWLFTNRRLPARRERHVMDGLFEFAELIGAKPGKPRWNIPVGAEDVAAIAPLFASAKPTLVISPCTGQRFRNYRNWRVDWYAQIADYAAERYGAQVLLTGGTTAIEQSYGREISATAKSHPNNLIGKTNLKQLLAILQRSSVLLCPDSGPAHMATAVATPVVGLYATSNRHRTGPYFSQHLVVDKYPEAVEREFGLAVDTLRWGQRVRDPAAMSLITVPDVIAKLDAALVTESEPWRACTSRPISRDTRRVRRPRWPRRPWPSSSSATSNRGPRSAATSSTTKAKCAITSKCSSTGTTCATGANSQITLGPIVKSMYFRLFQEGNHGAPTARRNA
jgi:heptosyltransferase I